MSYLRDSVISVVALAIAGNLVGAVVHLVRTRKGKS